MTKWLVVEPKYEDGLIHVMPTHDLREHYASLLCWCNPTIDEDSDRVAIHHAMDKREEYEEGKRPS